MFISHSSAVGNVGGAELTLLHLLDQWRELRPDVEFFVVARTPEGLMQAEFDRRGLQHRAIDFGSWVLPIDEEKPLDVINASRMNSRAVRIIAAWIREFGPDLVVSNTIVSPWGALAARLEGVPHAWMVHEYGDLDHNLGFRIGRAETFDDIGLLSELVVANSEAVRRHIAEWIPENKLTIAYPAIDLKRARQLAALGSHDSATAQLDDDVLRAVMVGRLGPSKGQWRLLHAVARLRDEGRPISVTLVGDTDSADAIDVLRLADSLGLSDQVSAVGETDNPFAHVTDAHIGVMASNCEAFGRVTLEYLALGKPVVASRSGANPELVVHGETGWLFDPDSVDDLVRVLREAHTDRAELSRRGVAARASVESSLGAKYPVADLVRRMELVAAAGAVSIAKLPNVTREWLALPQVVEKFFDDMHVVRTTAHASATWRVGRILMAPAKFVRRLVRRH